MANEMMPQEIFDDLKAATTRALLAINFPLDVAIVFNEDDDAFHFDAKTDGGDKLSLGIKRSEWLEMTHPVRRQDGEFTKYQIELERKANIVADWFWHRLRQIEEMRENDNG